MRDKLGEEQLGEPARAADLDESHEGRPDKGGADQWMQMDPAHGRAHGDQRAQAVPGIGGRMRVHQRPAERATDHVHAVGAGFSAPKDPVDRGAEIRQGQVLQAVVAVTALGY